MKARGAMMVRAATVAAPITIVSIILLRVEIILAKEYAITIAPRAISPVLD